MHIARVGRKTWRVRLGMAALYLVLILGAVTTLYPFLLMVSTATKSQSDFNEYGLRALAPRYWRDEGALYVKYLEDRYANNLETLAAAHGQEYTKVAAAAPPPDFDRPGLRILTREWNAFVALLPPEYKMAGFGAHENAPSPLLLRFQADLRERYGGDIAALNRAWTEENLSFEAVTPPLERPLGRTFSADLHRVKVRIWLSFRQSLPPHFLVTPMVEPLYRRFLREDRYEDDLTRLNAAWGTAYRQWDEIRLARTAPRDRSRADWETFIRSRFPLRMLYIRGLPLARLAAVHWARSHRQVAPTAIDYPVDAVPAGALVSEMDRIARKARIDLLHANSVENLWRTHLEDLLRSLERANQTFGTRWTRWDEAIPPQAMADARFVREHAGALRRDFTTRNFRAVLDYILLHGRAVGNTALFCLLAILGAVIVNPMCAYALSRYPLPYGYQVLVYLLATMAFPAEVAMIPNFLLLKELGMLNTFWALILPGLASGYSIFLLKGFFDSLPKELYEAGILDGASELTMFGRITLPLSLPIFSVIALNAFTASYGAFLYALVVCQDPRMWTLMVWLYNLQADAPAYVIMAALTLAALPTLLVFLAAQKVILRGIVLPSFK